MACFWFAWAGYPPFSHVYGLWARTGVAAALFVYYFPTSSTIGDWFHVAYRHRSVASVQNHIYFCNRVIRVFELPNRMNSEVARGKLRIRERCLHKPGHHARAQAFMKACKSASKKLLVSDECKHVVPNDFDQVLCHHKCASNSQLEYTGVKLYLALCEQHTIDDESQASHLSSIGSLAQEDLHRWTWYAWYAGRAHGRTLEFLCGR